MALFDLANELLLSILRNLECERDISALARTSRSVYVSIKPYLYRHNVQKTGSSAFFWAAEHGHVATAQASLDAGAHIEARRCTCYKETALQLASVKGHANVVAFLTRVGAQLDVENVHAHTALQVAILYRHEPVAHVLIESGADFRKDWPGFFFPTALHVASFYGLTSIVQMLLEKGVDIEARDAQMQTPLHWAVKVDALCEEEFIILNDPIRYFHDRATRSARSRMNAWKGNMDTVRLLLEKKANAYARDSSGRDLQKLTKNHPDTRLRTMFNNGSTVGLCNVNRHEGEKSEVATATQKGDTSRKSAKAETGSQMLRKQTMSCGKDSRSARGTEK